MSSGPGSLGHAGARRCSGQHLTCCAVLGKDAHTDSHVHAPAVIVLLPRQSLDGLFIAKNTHNRYSP